MAIAVPLSGGEDEKVPPLPKDPGDPGTGGLREAQGPSDGPLSRSSSGFPVLP